MEQLCVWVEGAERVIRGVDENTTCENVLIVLARAIGKSGKFALLEKWRDFERILPRNGKPLKCLRMWGALSGEIKFILKDDSDSDKLYSDLKGLVMNSLEQDQSDSLAHDPLKSSFQRKSLETFHAIQARRLERLARDLKLQSEEKCLYTTHEELAEDFATKICSVIKLQSNELLEKETWDRELKRQQNLNLKLTSELESQRNKIHLTNVHASDLDVVSEKLYLLLLHNRDGRAYNRKYEPSQAEQSPRGDSPEAETQHEISRLRQQLSKQTELAEEQRQELERVTRSIQEVDRALLKRRDELESLQHEADIDAAYYDLDENFDADQIEDSSITYEPGKLYLHNDQIKTREPAISLLARHRQKTYLSPPVANYRSHKHRQPTRVELTLEMEGVFV